MIRVLREWSQSLRVITLLVEEEGASPNGLLLEEVDAVEQTEWFIVAMKCIQI